MILESRYPDIVIPNIGFSQYVLKNLNKFDNDHVLLIDSTNERKTLTTGQLKDLTNKCANAFSSLGLCKDDIIATCFSNCLEFFCLLVGASACCVTLTGCNPNYTKDEIIQQFSGSQPSVVFIDAKDYQKMRVVQKHIPSLKYIFTMDECAECKSFEYFLNSGSIAVCQRNKYNPSEDVGLLFYSSGTTGLPKGVMLTQKTLVAYGEIFKISFPNFPTDVMYTVAPMFHILGALTTVVAAVQGCQVVVEKRFDVERFFSAVQKYKITHLSAVPPMLLAISNNPVMSKYNLSSLKVVRTGAAPLAVGVAYDIQEKLGVRVCQVWGLTEGVFTTSEPIPNTPINSVGSPVPNTELKVVDVETGNILGPYCDGEIQARNPLVMAGYYKNPEATARTIDSGGWLHTGDIGHYDQHGYIYIVDRLKELIKYKGFQVAPAELEEFLLRHPKISDAAVIGVPDAGAGEVPKAFVVKKDESLTEEEIHQFFKGKISSYKYLRGGVVFKESIPKSPSGKILRRELRALEQKSKL